MIFKIRKYKTMKPTILKMFIFKIKHWDTYAIYSYGHIGINFGNNDISPTHIKPPR